MNEEWWYRTLGQEFGPVDLAMIEQLLQGGTLDSTDQVRNGSHGQWLSPNNVASLRSAGNVANKKNATVPAPTKNVQPFPHDKDGTRQAAPANNKPLAAGTPANKPSAVRMPEERGMHIDAVSSTAEPESRSELSSAILQATQDSLQKQQTRAGKPAHAGRGYSDASDGFLRAIKGALGGILHILGLLVQPLFLLGEFVHDHLKPVAILLLAGVIIVSLVYLPQYWWTDAGIYEQLQAIRVEYDQAKSSSDGDQQWDNLTKRLQAQCGIIAAKLEPTANANRPVRLELFMIARDYLPAILQNSGEDSETKSDEEFDTHMAIVSYLLHPAGTPQSDSSWLMPAILAGDGLLLVIAGIWFVRRQR